MSATFNMLIGPAGSGKSTYAKKLCLNIGPIYCTYLSSDQIRKELYGSEDAQCNPKKVFEIMLQRAVDALNNNMYVIYDATNLKTRHRKETLRYLETTVIHSFFKEATVIKVDRATAKERNANRSRVVPEYVIDRMYRQFELPTTAEGWDYINIV